MFPITAASMIAAAAALLMLLKRPAGAMRLGLFLALAVTDGIGIAPEQVAELFNLFTQAKRKADRSQGGLGLGLALVKSLVELHGGQVTAHSEGLGKGSSFTVILPETPAPLPADHQASHDLEPRGH